MSSPPDDERFWQGVDAFIQDANQSCEAGEDPALVSAALLRASARFSAFAVANASLDRNAYIEEMDSALDYVTRQFREQLREDLEDYRQNYKVEIANNRPDAPDE